VARFALNLSAVAAAAVLAACVDRAHDAPVPTFAAAHGARDSRGAPTTGAAARPHGADPAPAHDVSIAIVSGRWHGAADDTWEYDLEVETDASFTQIVHQGEGRDCQQTGSIVAGGAELLRTFRDNECNHQYDGKTVHDRVLSLDASHMVLQMESDYLIRYSRAP
jgi:hypothetical protein